MLTLPREPPIRRLSSPSDQVMVSSMATEEYDEAIFDAALSTAGTRLLEAVETGDIAAVRAIVKKEHPPMFYQDPESGWSALHVAASIESSELLSFLLEEGAVWNAGW